jgi:hypothetical protein
MKPPLAPKAPSVLSTVIADAERMPRHPIEAVDRRGDLERYAEQLAIKNGTPPHYDKPVQPWDLIEHMDSSGDVLTDHLRATAIEHLFRIKEDLLEDLNKAQSEITKAIARLKKKEGQA